MKKTEHTFLRIIFIWAALSSHANAQTPGEWTWMNGTTNINYPPGVFGTKGVPDPANTPPGYYEPAEFTDKLGNFWLFGGYGGTPTGSYGDLWKFDPVINQWAWMHGTATANPAIVLGTQGVPSPSNSPGMNHWCAASWVDTSGNFWMFGGSEGSGSSYSVLWKYEPAINQWTWMHGPTNSGAPGIFGTQGVPDPANYPTARWETNATWTDDDNNLWLYGGLNAPGDYLWKYDISTNQWTWVKGSAGGSAPVHGTLGVSSPSNSPGSRQVYGKWKDDAGDFWMFGGSGTYNDLWRYVISSNEWTWMGGTSITNDVGTFGPNCIDSSTFLPAARYENRSCWKDNQGNFWFYGGFGAVGVHGDLWKYCTVTGSWTFVNGDIGINVSPVHGTLGVSSPLNKPGARMGSVGWSDNSGNLWLFSGWAGFGNGANDLWRFVPDPNCGSCIPLLPAAIFVADNHVCPGTCTDFTNLSQNATTYQWYFPGGVPSSSTDVNPAGICYYTPGNYNVTLIASNANSSDTLTLPNYMVVYPFSPAQNVTQSGDTLLSNSGFVAYQWFYDGDTIPGATSNIYIATISGDYSLISIDNNGCIVETVILNVIANVNENENVNNEPLVFPNPAQNQLSVLTTGSSIISFYNMMGEYVRVVSLYESGPGSHVQAFDISALRAGMYYVEIRLKHSVYRSKFVKE